MTDDRGTPDVRTLTVPEGSEAAAEAPVIALRERERGIHHALPAAQASFTIGTKPECDVVLDNAYVSKVHCMCERRGPGLRVRDHGSRNGTFIEGARLVDGEVIPGRRLIVAGGSGVSLLAMNEVMLIAEPLVTDVLGTHAHRAIDDLFSVARGPFSLSADPSHTDNVAILGEPGCDQDALVDVIHRLSRRNTMPLVRLTELPYAYSAQRELVEAIDRGTLVLTVSEETPQVDRVARELLFGAACRTRVVVVAPSASVAARVVGVEALARMHVVEVPPLRTRGADIDRLVDRELARRGAELRFVHLTAANQTALRSYAWPGNLPKLRAVVEWVLAAITSGSVRRAAEAVGAKRSTFQGWLAEVPLKAPFVSTTPTSASA
jgi:two-component system, NtrC family, response regulator GlrR